MLYIQAENTGYGFYTHEDRESFFLTGYPNNIWITDESESAINWIDRINGLYITKEQAEYIINMNIDEAERIVLP